MKKLLLVITMLASTTVFANTQAKGVLEFNVVKATFDSNQVHHAGKASLVVNYDKALITLNVEELRDKCPAGMMCTMMIRANVNVELPIVDIKVDNCGIRHLTAQVDQRPVDGSLQQITVLDPTQMTCKTFVAVNPEATYKTAYFDRIGGKSVENISKMILALNSPQVLETSLAPAILLKYEQHSGFAPVPTSKSVYIDVTGRVIMVEQQLKNAKASQTLLAQLSPEALKQLNTLVASIPVNSKLVDENEGAPRCMDAGFSSVSIVTKGKDLAIYQNVDCHTLTVQTGYSESLYTIMMGFVNLAQ